VRVLGRSRPPRASEPGSEGNITIADNVLSDVDVNVHLKDCRGVTVVGNTFRGGFKHDLLIEDSTNVVVGPNNLDRDPRYSAEDRGRANHGVVVRNFADNTLTGLHINGTPWPACGSRTTA